ncbi:MAG: hypothetical protein FWF29_07860, partial [Treponema sp.]|nr:hypothetical protein [Treponema sp.]
TFVRPNDGNYTVVERPVDGYVTPQAVAVAPSVQKASVFLVSKDNSKTKTTNVSYMVDTAGTWKMPGSSVDIKTQWNQGISGNQAVFNDMMQYNPTWIWDRQDSWAWGTSGSDIIHYTTTFHIDNLADIVPRDDLSSNPNGYAVPIYFACDNAAVLFVNGQFVACTANAFAGRDIPTYESGFTDLSNNGFDGNAWQTIYYADIFPFLNAGIGEAGDNQVVFYAANSEHVAGDTANSSYDTTNNPCGLIFAGVINMAKSIGGGDDYQFVNTVKPELGVAQGSITGVNAGVNGATQVASPSNSWFTYVDLQGKDLVTGIDIDMVSGNQGNKIYSVVGKAFVQLIGSNLQLTVKGEASTQNDSGIAALVTNQFPDKNPNSWVGGHTAENPRLIPYNGEKFLYIHTNGFRFLPIN